MQFQDDIQALRRGELDHENILGRIKSYLRRSESNPAEMRGVLDDARRADHITAADYDLLTQCIADASISLDPPRSDSGEYAASDLPEHDTAMTRLATSADTGGGDQGTVDIGSRLRDRFILDEVIGVGGMGTVYRGRDVLKIEAQDRNPYVAIKILNDSFKQRPDAFIVLQREASRQQRLAHPNIATVHDFDRTGGIMFITMEYLDGVPLDQFIKEEVRPKGGLKLPEAMPILEGMCSALSHAHARNIVHADFKPGNCFIAENRQLKVLDFGIARAMKDPARAGEETLFDPRSIGALTPAYASPEMLANNEDADPRDDIYALACVTYELLSGRHPYHRIPADQAKENGLKPERIKHLNRRQNDALARALAFERADRTPSANAFLEGLQQPAGGAGSLKVALAVGIGGLVLAGGLLLPGILERRAGDSFIEEISAGRIDSALVRLVELSRQQQIRVLQEGRPAILAHIERRFESLMDHPDSEVDFSAAQEVLAEGTGLFPDSAALNGLTNTFNRRREAHLSDIAQDFERYLAPQFLLPEPESDDLFDLIARLRAVDPTNPLLEDSRIPGVYADAVETALDAENFGLARQYLTAGLDLTPADPNLGDLRDRLQAVEQRIEREQTIARLTGQLQRGAAAAADLADLTALLPVVSELDGVAPDSTVVARLGGELAERFAGEIEAAGQAATLPEVEAYLDRAAPVWTALRQTEALAEVEAHRAALLDRQESLVREARRAMRRPDMRTADGRTAIALIGEVQAIDPQDPRTAVLRSELVQTRRGRAESLMNEADWAGARAELAALDGLNLSPEQQADVKADALRIDTAERDAAARAAAATQLAEAERQTEQARQERLRREQLAAERQTRVSTATQALDTALLEFAPSGAVASIRDVLDRMNELEALDPDSPALTEAAGRLDSAVAEAARGQGDTEAGLALVETAQDLLGNRQALADVAVALQARLDAERAAARRSAIAAAEAALDQALEDPMDLAEDGARQQADDALAQLIALAGADANQLAAAEGRYVQAHVTAAQRLIDEKRFTVAERVLDAAARQAGADQSASLAQVRSALAGARETSREERARQETLARIDALAQRFSLEVSSGQLTRARATLEEYRLLAPTEPLATGAGARQLADGYQRIGRQRLAAGNYEGARQLVTAGLEVVPGHDGLQRLGMDIQRATLENGIARWFRGDSGGSVAEVRRMTQRYRDLAPDGYADREAQWSAAAAGHLPALRGEPDTYNRFLQDARSVLANDGPLAGLATILPPPQTFPAAEAEAVEAPVAEVTAPPAEAPALEAFTPLEPSLATGDLLGRWCADQFEIEFERNRMAFNLNGGRVDYRVSGYDVSGDTIHVNFDDRRLGPMILEFGQFTAAKDKMVQIRGRPADDSDWQTYNRDFLRCG